MRIEKYNSNKLRDFIASDQYNTMPFLPVSRQRAESWMHNPRMESDDILLYLGFEGDEMIAYRSVLPDRMGDVRFGWLSGNWVRPDKRRSGHASRLFDEAWSDYGHQLMYTNYAPESKAVYDSTGKFELFREQEGRRYYARSVLSKLLPGRKTLYRRSRPALVATDQVINLFQSLRSSLKKGEMEGISFEESGKPDLEGLDFLERNAGTGFCERGLEDFEWICGFPWVLGGKESDGRYYFSSRSNRFRNICLKIRNRSDDMLAFLWLVSNEGEMHIPYLSVNREGEQLVSALVNHFLKKEKISILTVYNPAFTGHFVPGPILGSRKMIQNYFATRELVKQLPDPKSIMFQDGDGDVVFV